ncbi:MAG: PEP-CTERM sorting domain-containing protein [Fimbriimonadaceae bacterium]|jgi:hypothetical protein|nr:PEP-CTERM sorting domain-containing protein [Fimbriimonadaceae bacterium]
MKTILTLATLALGASFAVAQSSFTLATFKDPTNDSSRPLFYVTESTVSGFYTDGGLNLCLPSTGQTYNNLRMEMKEVTRAGSLLGGGTVRFYTPSDSNVFSVSWDKATYADSIALGGTFRAGQNVKFSGSSLKDLPPLHKGSFSFAFANGEDNKFGTTYTAAFTSSASAVPEPMTLTALAIGSLVASRRRRQKKAS